MEGKGFVYILVNSSFREDWVKIGRTENIEQRIKDLSSKTCLPYPFTLYAWCRTIKYKELEVQIHKYLDKYRKLKVVPNREFFSMLPSEALKELRSLASIIADAEIYAPGEEEEKKSHAKAAPPFRFSMVQIKPGSKLIFVPKNLTVFVKNDKIDNKIEFEGKTYTLSGFCKKFMPDEKRNKKDAYQGPAYFSYNGKLLVRLRSEMESAGE